MLYKTIFIIVLITFSIFSQEKDKVVASIGSYDITESEFQERFDFSVHPGLLQKGNRDSIKFDFLKQLIAEKLLAAEARKKNYDTLTIFKDILNPLENMYIRDQLYQVEIKNKAGVSPEEFTTGIERIKQKLILKFFHSHDPEELRIIHSKLVSGASFDSLLALRREWSFQPKEITFGTMDKQVEDIVYALSPGEFTEPVSGRDGFYILKLVNVEKNIQDKDNETITEDVRRIIFTRNEFKNYLQYYRNFFSPYKITADKEIFELLIPHLLNRLQSKFTKPDSTAKLVLFGNEVTSATEEINDDIKKKSFIRIKDRPVKVEYFLNQLSHEGFSVREINEISVRASLSSYIRKFIEDELLTQEARNKGLTQKEEVKKYLSMWGDSYLSKMMMVNILDSLKRTEPQIIESSDYYSEEVNLIEVLTDSLSTMEKIISDIASGRDLKEIAQQYTIRDSLRISGGETGFFPITKNGELGRIASQMNIGDIHGPIQLDYGYSIFKLIDRRIDSTKADNAIADLKEQYLMRSTLEKFETHMNVYNAALAQKYGVKIHEEVLKEIENVFMNLVVVRYMGFGGQIFAVPYTEQFPGWYNIWKNNIDRPNP